jgi:hypothetical protein
MAKKNSGQAPSIQLYYKDLYADIDEHPNDIVGAWVKILCKIWHGKSNGSVTKPIRSWCRVTGETENELKRILAYIKEEGIGGVEESNGKITIINYRTVRDCKLKEDNRLRQKKHREKLKKGDEKQNDNTLVTPKKTNPSNSKSNSSSKLVLELNKKAILFDDKLHRFFGDLTTTEKVTFRKIRLYLLSLRDLGKFDLAIQWIIECKQWGDDHGKTNVEVKKCFVSKIKKMGWKP